MPDETPNGYVIGFKELYDSIQALDRRLEVQLGEAAKTLVQHAERIKSLEGETASKRQMAGVWITCSFALVSSVIGIIASTLHL